MNNIAPSWLYLQHIIDSNLTEVGLVVFVILLRVDDADDTDNSNKDCAEGESLEIKMKINVHVDDSVSLPRLKIVCSINKLGKYLWT